jgi:four helix bundle protein
MRDHNLLRAFALADELVIEIYKITKSFPKEEIYCLTSQIRRAAISIPSNIVEGCARESPNEYCRFLEIAYSSLKEANYQFTLAVRLGFVLDNKVKSLDDSFKETERVLSSLLRANRKRLQP